MDGRQDPWCEAKGSLVLGLFSSHSPFLSPSLPLSLSPSLSFRSYLLPLTLVLVVETLDNDIEIEKEQMEIEGARGASTVKIQHQKSTKEDYFLFKSVVFSRS